VQPVGYEDTSVSDACENCVSNCPDCGKRTCEGLPHLCGVCLEQLSWNKADGGRIVPFGMLRRELIYSQQEQVADAIIFFLGPANPGVNDDLRFAFGRMFYLFSPIAPSSVNVGRATPASEWTLNSGGSVGR
jgi:hypothetical protein